MREFPPFRLDAVHECLWRSTPSGKDERILLSRQQYGLLHHLVEHAGQLVTRQELVLDQRTDRAHGAAAARWPQHHPITKPQRFETDP